MRLTYKGFKTYPGGLFGFNQRGLPGEPWGCSPGVSPTVQQKTVEEQRMGSVYWPQDTRWPTSMVHYSIGLNSWPFGTLEILHRDESTNDGNDVYGVLTISCQHSSETVCSLRLTFTNSPCSRSRPFSHLPQTGSWNSELFCLPSSPSAVDLSFFFPVDSLNFLGFAIPSKA